METSLRRRVNISISTKGVITWECTIDGEGWSEDEILDMSDSLVEKLKDRYPIEVEK